MPSRNLCGVLRSADVAADTSPMDLTVHLDAVSHRFGEVQALDELCFSAPTAKITVLLGPNGAGKTTTIRAITGAIAPLHGTVRTFGLDPAPESNNVRIRCGVVSAKPALYDRLSGHDNLLYSAQLYEVDPDVTEARIIECATRFGIQDALEHQVGGYSTGMKTRLALSRSLLHDPDLLLFDEPTSGLDPESSQAVLDLIRELTNEGKTVVMCTHLLSEAEGLADHVVIMESGRSLVEGESEALMKKFWPTPTFRIAATVPDQLDRLVHLPGVLGINRLEDAQVFVDHLGRIPALVAHLAADGVQITRVEPHEPTLEDLYFAARTGAGLLDSPLHPHSATQFQPGGSEVATHPTTTVGANS